ncbi:hypothetical protein I79_004661 [Cricetulus griseus]|uniref:Uncharacterized protein n=1 Tax=Cricetulus griseus TaxID=10029 RepID=G3H350_CRIGR|nr:hypothetical protein I79_004661 [Cricetulus griseus]
MSLPAWLKFKHLILKYMPSKKKTEHCPQIAAKPEYTQLHTENTISTGAPDHCHPDLHTWK